MTERVQSRVGVEIDQLRGKIASRDYLILAGIYKQCHPERANVPLTELKTTLEAFTSYRNRSDALFVARESYHARVIGAAMVYRPQETVTTGLHIDELFVEQRSRGHSVGRLLLQTCIDFAEQQDAAYIQMEHALEDVPSRKLFSSMDFMNGPDNLPRLTLGQAD